MAASDYLYQFCDFYISFAIIPQLQKQKIKQHIAFTIFTEISGEKISHVGEVLS